jgi:hypothetical protein
MTFILHDQRRAGAAETASGFRRYEEYLTARRERFPPQAFALATSAWYHDAGDHRCPHDAWLEEVIISEPAPGNRQDERIVTLSIRLLGAYHDGHIAFRYPRVFRYDLGVADGEHGHRDWRYDEFRLTDSGRVEHEIEWSGEQSTGRWLIEASDVEFTWFPGRGDPATDAQFLLAADKAAGAPGHVSSWSRPFVLLLSSGSAALQLKRPH